MKNRIFRTLALGLGLTAIFATSGLNAAYYSAKVNIPFEFRVGNRALGAGDYRVEQDLGKEVISLVNIKTGHRVQILRANHDRTSGNAKLIFENSDGMQILKKVL